MAEQNGGGASTVTPHAIVPNGDRAFDAFEVDSSEGSFEEHPELLLGAAFLAGLLLAGLVVRLGR